LPINIDGENRPGLYSGQQALVKGFQHVIEDFFSRSSQLGFRGLE
jgi:hypothetical protein